MSKLEADTLYSNLLAGGYVKDATNDLHIALWPVLVKYPALKYSSSRSGAARGLQARCQGAGGGGSSREGNVTAGKNVTVKKWFRMLLLSLTLPAAAALLGAACGGGGGNQATPSESPSSAPTSEPAAVLPTPATTPVISGDLFQYPERGYSVRIPQGWTAEANYLASPYQAIDLFKGPPGAVQPNISVTCYPLPAGTTPEKFFQDYTDVIAAGAGGVQVQTQPLQVSGVDAQQAVYTVHVDPTTALDKVEVFFMNSRCGWAIALVSPGGQLATFQPVLDQFLASFQLLPAS